MTQPRNFATNTHTLSATTIYRACSPLSLFLPHLSRLTLLRVGEVTTNGLSLPLLNRFALIVLFVRMSPSLTGAVSLSLSLSLSLAVSRSLLFSVLRFTSFKKSEKLQMQTQQVQTEDITVPWGHTPHQRDAQFGECSAK